MINPIKIQKTLKIPLQRAIYPPISDAQLRTLLGYGDGMEEQSGNGLLAFRQPPAFSEPVEVQKMGNFL